MGERKLENPSQRDSKVMIYAVSENHIIPCSIYAIQMQNFVSLGLLLASNIAADSFLSTCL